MLLTNPHNNKNNKNNNIISNPLISIIVPTSSHPITYLHQAIIPSYSNPHSNPISVNKKKDSTLHQVE